MEEIKLEKPLIKTIDNFLSKDQCVEILSLFETIKFYQGHIIDSKGIPSVDEHIRYSDVAKFLDVPIKNQIEDKLSEITGFDKSQFEWPNILRYRPGQYFNVHQDFFIHFDDEEYIKANKERCKEGGNRISTLIIYLNEDFEGGETYFPWTKTVITPKEGMCLQFDYNYEEWQPNMMSQHVSMPIIQGTKFIITIWVRETDRKKEVEHFKKFDKEAEVWKNINDVSYELECGPLDDRRNLTFDLPANYDPMNSIMVGFTGGLDSCLVLYLLGVLNNYQTIPYHIRPVYITSKNNVHNEGMLRENWEVVDKMVEYIQSLGTKNICPMFYIYGPIDSDGKSIVKDGLLNIFRGYHPKKTTREKIKFWKTKYIYTGDVIRPDDDHPRWATIGSYPPKSEVDFWRQPLFNLHKQHVIDALLQLGREDFIEMVDKCVLNHTDLLEICQSFPCNERRWGFYKLNKIDMGEKYFLNLRGIENDKI